MAKLAGIPVTDLIDKALIDLYRLQFADSAHSRYCKGFREFSSYCEANNIMHYDENTAQTYLHKLFDIDVTDLKSNSRKLQVGNRMTN